MQETISATVNKLGLFRSELSLTPISFSRDAINNALAIIESSDFPTTREESWKYTRLSKLANSKFSGTYLNSEIKNTYVHSDAHRFIFINGTLTHLSHAVHSTSIKEATEEQLGDIYSSDQLFDALNLAYAEDGLLIEIPAKTILEKPIEIIHYSDGNKGNNLRHIIRLGDFAKAEITLLYLGSAESNSFTNVVSNIEIGIGAHLTVNKLQSESGADFHFSREVVKQHKDSNMSINTLTLNGNFVRNDVGISVAGKNAESNLNGAYILRNNQLVDNHTIVDHLVANCQSNELYKGVLYDKSTAVFNGKVFVRQDAQKINAFQSNGNVLMSDDATVNSKPELEIYADDVKCSHGSTTGQLDEEAIYYLRARGLSEKSAKELLVTAFIADVLNKIENQEVLEFIYNTLLELHGWKLVN
jgi:Fe-S cluster assembly protein SufD